jgi:hypothetical protein
MPGHVRASTPYLEHLQLKDLDGRNKPGHDAPGVFSLVMPGLVPGIHAFRRASAKDVDGRDRPGHDEYGELEMHPTPTNRPARQTRRA